ncbi:hypothetical protein [Amycolatopsis marina]|uniref:hypothetical protein n=1 Tax=Amycolatopsis marina TaxID=490629 RepID=UPI00116045F8|nr:hypothetical protein [Amycolatopsis marina]
MSTETDSADAAYEPAFADGTGSATDTDSAPASPAPGAAGGPPTTPCTVVWSEGRPYVLEGGSGRPRWMGTDGHGRPQSLTGAQLERRGWSYRRGN